MPARFLKTGLCKRQYVVAKEYLKALRKVVFGEVFYTLSTLMVISPISLSVAKFFPLSLN
jgi:hypothetical protein